MKRLLALALCALFVLNAEARTLYVDASRPNNNGNGLSAGKAKKTIQAAVNVSKKGDTIIVLKGKYAAPLKTNNKKLRIKSRSGKAATTIAARKWLDGYSLDLGSGSATKMSGFTVTPYLKKSDWDPDYRYYVTAGGVRGGTLSDCTFQSLGRVLAWPRPATFASTKLTDCLLDGCYTDSSGKKFVSSCTLNRCKVVGSERKGGGKNCPVASSKLSNCLFSGNDALSFSSCILGNCTIAGNDSVVLKKNKAYNTIFHQVPASQFKKAKKNTLKNCYSSSAPMFAAAADGDYHLLAGSPCIDRGTKVAAARKLYGKKDLDGKKRIQGKSVDIGCYEGAVAPPDDTYDDCFYDDYLCDDLDGGIY